MPEDSTAALIDALPRLRRYAITLCHDDHTADDLVQETCARALAADPPGADTPWLAWLFTILRNHWFDRLRRRQSEGVTMDIDEMIAPPAIAGEDERVDARRTLARVRQAIDLLPQAQREVLLLVCVEDFTYRETAEMTGVPIGTVMSRLARARIGLAELAGLNEAGEAQNNPTLRGGRGLGGPSVARA